MWFKAYNVPRAKGKNFAIRDWFVFNELAPSLGMSMDNPDLPFSIKPEHKVSAREVFKLLRGTYEGTEYDMCKDWKMVNAKGDTLVSPVANPWLVADTRNTLISADYDHNVFVFGDIDETVRSLKNGQFFYIRPSEEDIIATQILDIEIEDDTATITGADNIDEMFDFIKIEIEQEDQSFHRDLAERITELPASETEDPAASEDAAPETEQTAEQRYLAGNYAPAGLVKDKDHEKFEFEIDAPGEELSEKAAAYIAGAVFARLSGEDDLFSTGDVRACVYKTLREKGYFLTAEKYSTSL